MLHLNVILCLLWISTKVLAHPGYVYYPNCSTTITNTQTIIATATATTTITIVIGPSNCPSHCGNGIVEPGEECDEGPLNGAPGCHCSKDCKINKPPPYTTPPVTPPPVTPTPPVIIADVCPVCNPIVPSNKCTITTSCIPTPSKKFYCACRAGYRADGLAPTDSKQFRLKFTGQEYRVFVAPGVNCDTLCTNPHPGPDSCKEVPVKDC